MAFHGRTRELAALRGQLEASGGALVPIWGRRRVGKSALVLRFLEDCSGVYVVGKEGRAEAHLRELLEQASRLFGRELPAEMASRGWKRLLAELVEAWRGEGPLVLALDEFQWLAQASPELPSVIQELWDRGWKDDPRVMVILCGSHVGFMERAVLGRKAPLFGRRTAQIKLGPFGFREARSFHPDWSLTDVARARFVCGGVPLYLEAFDPARSFEQNLAAALLDEYAPLYHEPTFLLREELRETPTYYTVLTALAEQPCAQAALARRTGLPAQSLTYYLGQLTELGYVQKQWPLTGRPPTRRSVRYVVSDPLLRFWFRFLQPHQSRLRVLGPTRFFQDVVAPGLASWMGQGFEHLCREALEVLYVEEGVTGSWEVGEWWSREAQVDVVGVRSDGWTDLGECKWGAVRSQASVVAELKARAERFPNPREATLGLRVFARKGVTRSRERELGVRWTGLEELYGGRTSPR